MYRDRELFKGDKCEVAYLETIILLKRLEAVDCKEVKDYYINNVLTLLKKIV